MSQTIDIRAAYQTKGKIFEISPRDAYEMENLEIQKCPLSFSTKLDMQSINQSPPKKKPKLLDMNRPLESSLKMYQKNLREESDNELFSNR